MKFIYLSRRNNRSGYYILEHLLEKSGYRPEAVVLPTYAGRKIHKQMLNKKLPHEEKFQRGSADIDHSEVNVWENSSVKFQKSIEDLCDSFGVPILELEDINTLESIKLLRGYKPDLIALGGGWPQLLSDDVSKIPALGVINTHPSLLPLYRGTDVHRWQVFKGGIVSGTTIHYVDQKFDTGDIISQKSITLAMEDTPQSLAERAALVAGPLMERVLIEIEAVEPERVSCKPQNNEESDNHYFSRWPWEDLEFLKIRWDLDAVAIFRFIKACTQEDYRYNGPYFSLDNKPYMVREACLFGDFERMTDIVPGYVLRLTEKGPVIACGKGSLVLTSLQEASPEFWPKSLHSSLPCSGQEFMECTNLSEGQQLI